MTTTDGTSDVITKLRDNPRNLHVAGGFGPLLAAAILFLLMLVLAPSVAPERVVVRPARTTVTTVAR
jgi:hypothetical protein